MRFKHIHTLNLLLLLYAGTVAQELFFEVTSIEGTAKMQQSQKKGWEKITTAGTRLPDNTLVETWHQAQLIMKFGEGNTIVLGSNSKALLNIVYKQNNRKRITSTSLTLFGGGAFVKAASGCHVSFYSSNAVGEMDSGSTSIVFDVGSGETGFQVLEGTIYVRNIVQQKNIQLRAGLTTTVMSNKEPSVPLHLANKHVAALKQCFGDDYIGHELDLANIEPVDEPGWENKLAVSKSLSVSDSRPGDQKIYKPLFDPDRVYGSILNGQTSFPFYKPLNRPQNIFANKGSLKFVSDFGINSGDMKKSFSLIPSVHLPKLKAALRLTAGQNHVSGTSWGFSSVQGLLDKIQYFYLGDPSDSTFFFAGKIKDYSLGYGLIVDNFSNDDPNRIFNSPGSSGQIHLTDIFDFKAFLGDLTNPVFGGAYISFRPSVYSVGAGYYFDADPHKVNFYPGEFRYVTMEKPQNSTSNQRPDSDNLHIYEIDFAADIVSGYDFRMKAVVELAQRLQNGNGGMVARMPTILCDISNMTLGASLVIETKRLLSSCFNPFYLSGTGRAMHDAGVSYDSMLTYYHLSNSRRASGFALTFKANPVKGMDLDVYYKQDILSRNTHLAPSDQNPDSTGNINGDFTLRFKCSVNDTLVPFLKYADIYLQQYHGRLFPPGATLHYSWMMQSGFNLITRPFFKNMAFEAGGRLLYIDVNKNNLVDGHLMNGEDRIFEFFIGMQWGFL